MQKIAFLIIFLTLSSHLFAQFEDNFDQGDISSWNGDNVDFMVNSNGQLQLDATGAGQSLIYQNIDFPDSLTWDFDIKLQFSPSTNNNLRVLLAVDDPGLSVGKGYILNLGESGTEDAIKLIYLDSGVENIIATGSLGLIASSFNLNIKLIKDGDDNWSLSATDLDDGSISEEFNINFIDNDIETLTYFGFQCNYTSSNSDNFIFDNILIKQITPDLEPPSLVQFDIIDNQNLRLLFSEDLNESDVINLSNYSITPDNDIINIIFDTNIANQVTLEAEDVFSSCSNSFLEIINITDLNSNRINPIIQVITVFEKPKVGDILINELLSNPIGNDVDYVEFINVSGKSLEMKDLIIRNDIRDDEEIITTDIKLMPGEIIAFASDIDDVITKYNPPSDANIVEQKLPGFNNANGNVMLISSASSQPIIIDSYTYDDKQLSPNLSDKDGASFERISCVQSSDDFSNWSSPNPLNGLGTPGYLNSIADLSNDFAQITFINSQEIEVRFKSQIDETSAVDFINYNIQGISFSDIIIDNDNPKVIVLFLNTPLENGAIYSLNINNIETKCGDILGEQISEIKIVADAEVGDLLINEILFNPFKDQVDFVEIINVSDKFIRLDNLNFYNQNSGNVEDILTEVIIEPQQIIAFTEDPDILISQYDPPNDANILLQDLPSFNDSDGNVSIRIFGVIDFVNIDAFDYSEDFHFELIRNNEGISLERISLIGDTNDATNWFSSAEENNYATPGYENSSRLDPAFTSKENVSLAYKTFSPNGDSDKDVMFLNYNLSKAGFLANVRVYDDRGRQQQILSNNSLLASQGFIRWDGINTEGALSPIGMYIIHYEFFHPDGEIIEGKKVCILAQRLN